MDYTVDQFQKFILFVALFSPCQSHIKLKLFLSLLRYSVFSAQLSDILNHYLSSCRITMKKALICTFLLIFSLFSSLVRFPHQPAHAQAAHDISIHRLADGGFFQDWSDPNLITVNDDWSAVPAIVGYRGDNLTNKDGIDPQTLLQDDVPGVMNVYANKLAPNTFTNGGVTEFEGAIQTIALSGSGTADAPYIKITLDTSTCSDIRMKYNLKDLDGSADNAIQPVALHYRVSGSGNFTNVPEAYVADATTGPKLADKITPIDVTLPSQVNDQPLVELRVMTTNAVGNDEWVGIDDIEISGTCNNPYANPILPSCPTSLFTYEGTPVLASFSATDADGKVVQAFLQEPIITGISLVNIVPADAIAGTLTGNLFIDNDTPGGTYPLEMVFFNADPSPQSASCIIPVTVAPKVCPIQNIHQIGETQGQTASSPLAGQNNITVSGIVTANFSTGGMNGFYLQDIDGDANPSTSDGIFIQEIAPELLPGQPVQVTGKVEEYYARTQMIDISSLTICGIPGQIALTPITLPVFQRSDLEKYEGMLVTFPQALAISENYNFGRYGEITLTSARHSTPTSMFEPGSPQYFQALEEFLLDRIILDDGRTSSNPDPAIHPNGQTFDLDNLFRNGDQLIDVTGVLDFSMGEYRIQPVQGAEWINSNPRPPHPAEVGGDIKIASFNVLNYFTTLGSRGADIPEEFTRQRTKIITALSVIDADIVALIEIENNDAAIQDLISGLNSTYGREEYTFVNTGKIGVDEIKVAIIYKPATIHPVGNYALLDSSVDIRFIDTKNRPSLAQSFQEPISGEIFTIAANHFKSKGSSCETIGDLDAGNGAGNCNLTRTAAAQSLVDWLGGDPTHSGSDRYLILGDLNAYTYEDPIVTILAGADNTADTPDDYVNLIEYYLGDSAYSYVFDGQTGYLDHALANSKLAPKVTGATIWHINADEPSLIDYDMTYKKDPQDQLYAPDAYRSSDHDPVIIGLSFANVPFFPFQIFIPMITR